MKLNKTFFRPSFIALLLINILSFNLITEINSQGKNKNHNHLNKSKNKKDVRVINYSTDLKESENEFPLNFVDHHVKCPTGSALSDFQAWY